MQNSFRIRVKSIELFRRSRSPIAPNANPATSRANDGKLASMPVFAKLNWSTSFMNFGAAEIIETKLIRKCWPEKIVSIYPSSRRTGPTSSHNAETSRPGTATMSAVSNTAEWFFSSTPCHQAILRYTHVPQRWYADVWLGYRLPERTTQSQSEVWWLHTHGTPNSSRGFP